MEEFEDLIKSIPKQKNVTTDVIIKLLRGIGNIIIQSKNLEIELL